MSILGLPSGMPAPSRIKFGLKANTLTFQTWPTPMAGTEDYPGAVWTAEATWNNLGAQWWRPLSAVLAQLRGRAGRLYFGPSQASAPQAAIPSDSGPAVYGAGQTGNAIRVCRITAGAILCQAGDWFHIDTLVSRELKQVTATPAPASWRGITTLEFEPPLRAVPANRASLVFDSPQCVMGLADDASGAMSFSAGAVASLTLSLVERIGTGRTTGDTGAVATWDFSDPEQAAFLFLNGA